MEQLFCVNERIRRFERVVIYGTGGAGRALLMKTLQHNIKVDCFADSNPGRCGGKILNVPVKHIKDKDLLAMSGDAAVIIGGLHIFEVVPELEKLGFRHIFQDLAGPDYLHLERGV